MPESKDATKVREVIDVEGRIPLDYAKHANRLDEFDLTPTYKKELGITDDYAHIWVRNPARYPSEDRVQDVKDQWPGSSVVTDAFGDPVRRNDVLLMKVPKPYLERRDAELVENARAYTAQNPVLAAEMGMSEGEIARLLLERGNPEVLAARDEEFSTEDWQKVQRRSAAARAESIRRKQTRISMTQGKTYEEAANFMLRRLMREYGVSDTREGVKLYEAEMKRKEDTARNNNRADRGRDAWKEDMQRYQRRAMGSVSVAVGETGLGKTTREKIRERKGAS